MAHFCRVFSKESRDKERVRLADELNRGYFDDFKELKQGGGKVATASAKLVPVTGAVRVPELRAYTPQGSSVVLPPRPQAPSSGSSNAVTLVCFAFRASAQPMVESWSAPFAAHFAADPAAAVFEVSMVESWVLSLAPVRALLLRSMASRPVHDKRTVVYSFGDTWNLRNALQMRNRLVGYAYLVDRQGRVRWRASGAASSEEIQHMLTCTSQLLQEQQQQAAPAAPP
eukprot:jgi/Mesen1/10481/ME000083S09988